jgi:adenylate kinase family enzyme
MIGKKIAVVGVLAAGKTTFARKLAQKTHLPLILIDSVMWKAGWEFVGTEETAQRLDEESSKPEWIIEGFLVKNARIPVLGRADTIIFLDYSAHVRIWRYFKRWWKHRKNPRPELEGSPERFTFKSLETSWTKAEMRYIGDFIAQPQYADKIVTLRSPREAEEFLKSL